jgi:hypothetical protein
MTGCGADPVAHLARMIARYGCPKTASLAMLWAYFDETIVSQVDGQDGKRRPTEMFVGGCVSAVTKWEEFTPRWRAVLDEAKVTSFHATDFYSFQGEFRWFYKNGKPNLRRHARFRDKLADIILDHVDELIVFTSMVPIKDRGTRKAYADAALRAVYDATKFRTAGKDSLYIVLARHPELSPWSILKWFEQINWEQKLAGCGIFRPDDVLPLQAADYVLNVLNKAWGGLTTPALKRLQQGCRKRKIPFLQQIASSADMKKLSACLSSGKRPT